MEDKSISLYTRLAEVWAFIYKIIPMARLPRQHRTYSAVYPICFLHGQACKWLHLIVYWHTKSIYFSMIRKYIGCIFYQHFQTYMDSQVFLAMVAHAQAVDTRPFFSPTLPGYNASLLITILVHLLYMLLSLVITLGLCINSFLCWLSFVRFISLNAPNVLAVTFVFPVYFLKESLHLLSCLGHLLLLSQLLELGMSLFGAWIWFGQLQLLSSSVIIFL